MRGETVESGFYLGPWWAAPALNRLVLDGVTTQVEPKVMAVLVVLARAQGQVVSRDQLLDDVWQTRNASSDLPRRAIYGLRRILGDDPKQPVYIETIPRTGYRLLIPVTLTSDGNPEPGPAVDHPIAPSAPRRSRRRVAGLSVLVMVAVLATAGFSGLLQPEREVMASRIVPLTSAAGLEYDPALSPDGHRVAFVGTHDEEADTDMALYVQQVGESASLRLTTEPASFNYPIESPTWSSDGTRIAFLRWRPRVGWSVHEVPAMGGQARQRRALGRAGASGLDWSPAGDDLALGLRGAADLPYALHRLSLGTGALDLLTRPPRTSVGDHHPAWSPDGSTIAFVRTLVPDVSEVHVVPASGGASRSLLSRRHKIAAVDWHPDGRHVVIAVHQGGRHRLWEVAVAGGAINELDDLGDDTRFVSLARHGDRLAYARTEYTFGLWQMDLDTGSARSRPELSSTFFDTGLDIAPDGQRVALVSTRSGASEIWVSNLDGERTVRLTTLDGDGVGDPRWLPDGRALVFHASVDGTHDLWTAGTDGSGPLRLTDSPSDDRMPFPEPNGQTIVFASDRSGDWQLWRMPIKGGDAQPVTRDGGYRAQVMGDGRWIYYTQWRRGGLWRVPQAGGEEQAVLDEETLPAWASGHWTLEEDGVYFVSRDAENRVTIAFHDFDASSVTREWPLAGVPIESSLALTPDRRSIFFTQLDRLESDLVLVELEVEPAED